MAQLVFNFFKRSLLLPALIAGLLVAGALYYCNGEVAASQSKLTEQTESALNMSGYTQTPYTAFSQLNAGDFAGTLKGEDFALSECVFCYDAGTSSVSLEAGSTEPWNGGALLLTGTSSQLKGMHSAEAGSVLTLHFGENGDYRYAVKEVVAGLERGDLNAYRADGTLCVAFPYNNLASAAQPSFYVLFIAQQL